VSPVVEGLEAAFVRTTNKILGLSTKEQELTDTPDPADAWPTAVLTVTNIAQLWPRQWLHA